MHYTSPILRRLFAGIPTAAGDTTDASVIVQPVFDRMVAAIANPAVFADSSLNELGGLLWRLVGSRVTEFALTDMSLVKSLSFMGALMPSGVSQGVLLAPIDRYATMLREDPWMQLGGVVFVASQARDFWNGRLTDGSKRISDRAAYYEARFLRLVAQLEPSFRPNSYQQPLLTRSPGDLPRDLDYEAVPYDFDRAVSGFKSYSGAQLRQPVPPPHEQVLG